MRNSGRSDALQNKGSNSSSITLAESGGLRAQRALQRPLHVGPSDDVAVEGGAGGAHALDDVERELLVPDVELGDGAHEGLVGAETATHGILFLSHHQQPFACRTNRASGDRGHFIGWLFPSSLFFL